MLLEERSAPASPFTTEAEASEERFMNFAAAVTARMPRMTMTTMSSIRVKPLSALRMALLPGWIENGKLNTTVLFITNYRP